MASNLNSYTATPVKRVSATVVKNRVGVPRGITQYDAIFNVDDGRPPAEILAQLQNMQIRYFLTREQIPVDSHPGFVRDLYPAGYEFGPEALWFAGRLTPANVVAVVDALIDPVLAWYQQEYEKTYGYSNLHAAKGLFKTMWAGVPADVKQLYRRDADLMVCVTVLSELFQVLKMKDDLRWLNMKTDGRNWRLLVDHVDAVLTTLLDDVFPLVGVGL